MCVPGGQSEVQGVAGGPLMGRARPRRQSRPLKGTERGLLDMTRRLQGGSRAGDQRRKLFWGVPVASSQSEAGHTQPSQPQGVGH